MLTAEAREAAKAEYLNYIRRLNLTELIATLTASDGKVSWEVRITKRGGEYFEVCGRSSRLDLYLMPTIGGYLVAVPNYQRAGLVPEDCNEGDIMEYCDIDNRIDAITLATAVRYLIRRGFADGPQG
ncbi:hypothetical protein [Moorella sp. E306M]|uniref:hypothetical protein n=1 Tax=Moorella sp. E306M TaxID=2572683 RepID=UPI0010FFB22C|nr:hypothetical protein [Moorella sp. E306M]GEA17531.1 hypothetical protein E306M_06650 [Moorella sp. E306M]